MLLAHHLLAYFFALERDWQRLDEWRSCSWMPLGAGALAGVNYPLDREQVAAELGFDRVAPNAMDAVAARDYGLLLFGHRGQLCLTLSRLAGEIGAVEHAGVRSCLAARVVDVGLEHHAAEAQSRRGGTCPGQVGRVPGAVLGLGAVLKGLPLAYNGDLQEDKLYVFASRQEFDLCLEAMTAMVEGLAVRPRSEAGMAAEGGYAQATDVADYLVGKGLPFREAHRIAGRLVGLLAPEGRALSAATLSELKGLSPLFADDYYAVVDLDRVVASKISPGGTAPPRVAEQLTLAADVLGRLERR